ncbi:uncharacterized protein [Acropora muricata]|uniref:uncharacterized protein isoform X2 n=1 Tax=Acropora muricata TaxID=159855 RepID=UPI0034E3AAEB
MPFSLCSSVAKLSESPGCTAPFHQSHGGRKLDKGKKPRRTWGRVRKTCVCAGEIIRAEENKKLEPDECRAGCITGRVLHLHVPTLARMACCYAHQGELNKARESADQAIILDFTNPDLFCVRALVNYLLCQQKKALSDASFAIHLHSNHVCGWLLRGLFRKLKKDESNILKKTKQEPDLVKACGINPYAMTFVNIKNIRDHFQTMFDRFLPSFRVSHTLSIRDVIDSKTVSSGVGLPYKLSSKTFVCGVARPQRIIRTCPSKENAKELVRCLEGIHSERSISHHKQSLACNDLGLIERGMTSRSLLDNPSKSLVPRLTLKDVVDAKSACICRHEKIIGRRGPRHRENMLDDNDDISNLTERMYSRKWLQDRIPAKIPDIAGCRQFPQ